MPGATSSFLFLIAMADLRPLEEKLERGLQLEEVAVLATGLR